MRGPLFCWHVFCVSQCSHSSGFPVKRSWVVCYVYASFVAAVGEKHIINVAFRFWRARVWWKALLNDAMDRFGMVASLVSGRLDAYLDVCLDECVDRWSGD